MLEFGEKRSRYIRPIVQLLIALRFYALGSMQITVADFAGVCRARASVCCILVRVSDAIARERPNYVKMPQPQTEEEMKAASHAFADIASFPRVIGTIDCTHIKIQSPGGDQAEQYRNRKGVFSFNVQTVAAANLKVINIVGPLATTCSHYLFLMCSDCVFYNFLDVFVFENQCFFLSHLMESETKRKSRHQINTYIA